MWSRLTARGTDEARISLRVIAVFSLLAVLMQPSSVAASSTPTESIDNTTPAGFLPAPNPNPYCSGTGYFSPWSLNEAVLNGAPTQTVVTDTATTGPGGVTATFTTTVNGTVNGGVTTPSVFAGAGASIGIVMNAPAEATVSFSEPLFYSQWVFTDMDQRFEGFDLTPSWAGGAGELAIFGGDALWSFTGSHANLATFHDTGGGDTNGFDLAGRAQVDFFAPITSFDLVRTGAGGSGFTAGAGCEGIGAAKTASSPIWDPATGRFLVDYTIEVVNNLPNDATLGAALAAAQAASETSFVSATPTGITETNLQLTDELQLAAFDNVVISNMSTTGDLTPNPNFDGDNDTNLLTGSDSLAPESSGSVTFSAAYTPDLADPAWSDCAHSLENQSAATATASGVTVSDHTDNGTDPAPTATNGFGGTDDPTPVTFNLECGIGLAKTVTAGPTSNGDGSYDIQYTLVANNSGEVPIMNPVINDDLAATFGSSLTSSTVSSDTCTGSTLDPNDVCSQVIDVTVTPSGSLGPWINSATVEAIGPGGSTVSDTSQNGSDPDPDGDSNPANNNEPTPVSLTETPGVGLTKEVTGGPINNGDRTYTIEYTLTATNTGDVPLSNITIDDDLTATFGTALTSSTLISDSCDTAKLNASTPPGSGDSCTQVISATVTPAANLGPYNNQGTVTGESPAGTTVSDTSQNGSDYDPDGDGDPNNNSEPTPVSLTENPQIGLTKTVTNLAATGTGQFSLDYVISVHNTGDVPLDDVTLVDNLDAAFGSVAYTVTGVDASAGSVAIRENATFTGAPGVPGTIDSDDLVDGTIGLAPDESATVIVSVVITPGGSFGSFDNTATSKGTSPAGVTVSDDSNDSPYLDSNGDGDPDDSDGDGIVDHLDSDPDGDGDPTNNNTPTPLTLPGIGTTKALTQVENNGDGSYNVTYDVSITNVGGTRLDSVQLADDLAATFATTSAWSIVSTSSPMLTVDANFDGSANPNMLTGDDSLAIGETGLVSFVVSLTPGSNLGLFENTATATGQGPEQTLPDGTIAPGATVSDDSQNSAPGDTNSDPNGNGDPSDDNEPTPLQLDESPAIATTKALAVPPVDNGDGSYTMTFALEVFNIGDIELSDVSLKDDLATTFGAGSTIVVNSIKATAPGSTNTGFDGVGDNELLSNTNLGVGESTLITFEVTVTPSVGLTFENGATAIAASPSGALVSDQSQDQGTDPVNAPGPDPDGDGDPSNNNDKTPIRLIPNAVDDQDLDNAPGSSVKVDLLRNDEAGLDPSSVEIYNTATGQWSVKVTVPGEGTWTIDPLTGAVTFVPEAGHASNPAPVKYRAQITGIGSYQQAQVTVSYLEPEPVDPPTLAFTGQDSKSLIHLGMWLTLLGATLLVNAGIAGRRRKGQSIS